MTNWFSKIGWDGAGVIASLFGTFIALGFSVKSCCQSNETAKNQEEIKKELQIEKLKTSARDWFADGEYDKSFEYYQQVHLLDTINDEGYRKFLDMGKNLLTKGNNKYDKVIKTFFERAKQFKNTPEINKLLEQCE
ncbi:MAG: hypothetical protein LBG92_00755 [Prevotellaceae bacterium]|jgi:hypothetical protein|nr:hypothetical protein [Prevotellaceae bacterium]